MREKKVQLKVKKRKNVKEKIARRKKKARVKRRIAKNTAKLIHAMEVKDKIRQRMMTLKYEFDLAERALRKALTDVEKEILRLRMRLQR